jgi:hypothetical protein
MMICLDKNVSKELPVFSGSSLYEDFAKEDGVELFCHGQPKVVHKVTNATLK